VWFVAQIDTNLDKTALCIGRKASGNFGIANIGV